MLKRLLNKTKASARRNLGGNDRLDNGGPSQEQRTVYPVDANWINLAALRAWAGHECPEYPKFGSPPTWLIDVRKNCLVSPAQLPGDAAYCALSYVWGQVETGKLTTATREAFCRPGAFSASSPTPIVIPKTIRHAMGLVRELGEQYLWVDSLCIIQDEEMGHELANMGAIYDRATLTIVAATAWDADDGLRGIRGISGPRHLAAFGDDLNKYLDPESMIWNSRAWTFQEGQFSRRMLLFCDQTVVCKCLCSCTDEVGTDLAAEAPEGRSLAHVNLLLRGKSNLAEPFSTLFDEYCKSLISPYNVRNCTRTADLPRAFEGIAHALTETAAPGTLFSKGLCWGLPVAFLPHALTWCAAEENLRPRDQLLGFPSWSWMAWEGNIMSERLHYREWSEFQLDPRPRCEWDIVYPESTSRQSSAQAPGVAQRAAMIIKGEFCILSVPSFRWTYHVAEEPDEIGFCSAVSELDPPKSVTTRIYADQVNVMATLRTKEVYLVGISTFRERFPNSTFEGTSLVKAIWVAPTDKDPILGGKSVPRFRRQGVALVNISDWDRGMEGSMPTTILLE